MVKRRKKKKKSGSHGYGSSKKNRGAGNRGGRGNAGTGKKGNQKKMTKEGVHKLGEEGFQPYGSEEQNGINLRDIDQRIERFVQEGFAEETDTGYVFHAKEAGYEKILGGGQLRKDIDIEAEDFSDSAKRKIEEAGSEAIETEE